MNNAPPPPVPRDNDRRENAGATNNTKNKLGKRGSIESNHQGDDSVLYHAPVDVFQQQQQGQDDQSRRTSASHPPVFPLNEGPQEQQITAGLPPWYIAMRDNLTALTRSDNFSPPPAPAPALATTASQGNSGVASSSSSAISAAASSLGLLFPPQDHNLEQQQQLLARNLVQQESASEGGREIIVPPPQQQNILNDGHMVVPTAGRHNGIVQHQNNHQDHAGDLLSQLSTFPSNMEGLAQFLRAAGMDENHLAPLLLNQPNRNPNRSSNDEGEGYEDIPTVPKEETNRKSDNSTSGLTYDLITREEQEQPFVSRNNNATFPSSTTASKMLSKPSNTKNDEGRKELEQQDHDEELFANFTNKDEETNTKRIVSSVRPTKTAYFVPLKKEDMDKKIKKEGAKIVPCRARRMPEDHNERNAYFVVPKNIQHGDGLLCSHVKCQNKGIRFVYCVVCDHPVAKFNFSTRHKHSDVLQPKLKKQHKDNEEGMSSHASAVKDVKQQDEKLPASSIPRGMNISSKQEISNTVGKEQQKGITESHHDSYGSALQTNKNSYDDRKTNDSQQEKTDAGKTPKLHTTEKKDSATSLLQHHQQGENPSFFPSLSVLPRTAPTQHQIQQRTVMRSQEEQNKVAQHDRGHQIDTDTVADTRTGTTIICTDGSSSVGVGSLFPSLEREKKTDAAILEDQEKDRQRRQEEEKGVPPSSPTNETNGSTQSMLSSSSTSGDSPLSSGESGTSSQQGQPARKKVRNDSTPDVTTSSSNNTMVDTAERSYSPSSSPSDEQSTKQGSDHSKEATKDISSSPSLPAVSGDDTARDGTNSNNLGITVKGGNQFGTRPRSSRDGNDGANNISIGSIEKEWISLLRKRPDIKSRKKMKKWLKRIIETSEKYSVVASSSSASLLGGDETSSGEDAEHRVSHAHSFSFLPAPLDSNTLRQGKKDTTDSPDDEEEYLSIALSDGMELVAEAMQRSLKPGS